MPCSVPPTGKYEGCQGFRKPKTPKDGRNSEQTVGQQSGADGGSALHSRCSKSNNSTTSIPRPSPPAGSQVTPPVKMAWRPAPSAQPARPRRGVGIGGHSDHRMVTGSRSSDRDSALSPTADIPPATNTLRFASPTAQQLQHARRRSLGGSLVRRAPSGRTECGSTAWVPSGATRRQHSRAPVPAAASA